MNRIKSGKKNDESFNLIMLIYRQIFLIKEQNLELQKLINNQELEE